MKGLRTVLAQRVDGTERVEVFAYHSFWDAEERYSVIEREALTCS